MHGSETAFKRQVAGQSSSIMRATPEISFKKAVTTGCLISDTEGMAKRAYLYDIFNLLNELSLSLKLLQERKPILKLAKQAAAFKDKLEFVSTVICFSRDF